MPKLVFVRHGQSQWNLENRFTGETDVELTEKGKAEALDAGKKLQGYHFDIAFTSKLKRAQDTLHIILNEIEESNIPIMEDRALNERNYGKLQGLNKADTAKKFGEEQVHIWRRSYDVAPPEGESLKDTYNRVIPYYQTQIAPKLRDGKNIIIAAHGNSLRSLMMYLENISAEKIVDVNIPTGVPRVYEFDNASHIISCKYL